jgi:hypothetical protein
MKARGLTPIAALAAALVVGAAATAAAPSELVLRKSGSKAELLVRRKRVVWQLEVAGGGLLTLSKPALLVELRKYAAKQRARVGAG